MGVRLAASFVFAFLCWSAVLVGTASRACHPGFDLRAGLYWFEMLTVMGLPYAIAAIAIGAGVTYFVAGKLPAAWRAALFVAVPVLTFAYFVLTTHYRPDSPCIYP